MNIFAIFAIVALLHFGGSHATPCNTFENWIKMGTAVTSIRCIENNSLGISMPSEIGTLTNLVELQIVNELLNSQLPTEIRKLTKLLSLDLRTNLITGNLPDLTPLTALTSLLLGSNSKLAPQSLPNLGNMAGLKYLNLYQTQRTGTVPASYNKLVQLQHLEFASNNIRGTIPDSVADLPNVVLFDIRANAITGTLPLALARPALTILEVQNNQLSGSLSAHTFSGTTFFRLGVKQNRFTGTMPSFLYSTEPNRSKDVSVNEALSTHIPNGSSCSGNTNMCTAGPTNCAAKNLICCSAMFTAPNVRDTCSFDNCEVGTGACVMASPTKVPSKSPSPIISIAPSKSPNIQRNNNDESVLQIGLAGGTGLCAVVVGFLSMRQRRRRTAARAHIVKHAGDSNMSSPFPEYASVGLWTGASNLFMSIRYPTRNSVPKARKVSSVVAGRTAFKGSYTDNPMASPASSTGGSRPSTGMQRQASHAAYIRRPHDPGFTSSFGAQWNLGTVNSFVDV